MTDARSAWQVLKDHVAGDCPDCVPSARLPEMCAEGQSLWAEFDGRFDNDYPTP